MKPNPPLLIPLICTKRVSQTNPIHARQQSAIGSSEEHKQEVGIAANLSTLLAARHGFESGDQYYCVSPPNETNFSVIRVGL